MISKQTEETGKMRQLLNNFIFPNIILELKDSWLQAADEQSGTTTQGILHVRNSLDPQQDEDGVGKKTPEALSQVCFIVLGVKIVT